MQLLFSYTLTYLYNTIIIFSQEEIIVQGITAEKSNMLREKLRVFGLLLYKNFLVRQRHWKVALFVEILIPILLFASVWDIRNEVAAPPQRAGKNETYDIRSIANHRPDRNPRLHVVPYPPFIKALMEDVRQCLGMDAGECK